MTCKKTAETQDKAPSPKPSQKRAAQARPSPQKRTHKDTSPAQAGADTPSAPEASGNESTVSLQAKAPQRPGPDKEEAAAFDKEATNYQLPPTTDQLLSGQEEAHTADTSWDKVIEAFPDRRANEHGQSQDGEKDDQDSASHDAALSALPSLPLPELLKRWEEEDQKAQNMFCDPETAHAQASAKASYEKNPSDSLLDAIDYDETRRRNAHLFVSDANHFSGIPDNPQGSTAASSSTREEKGPNSEARQEGIFPQEEAPQQPPPNPKPLPRREAQPTGEPRQSTQGDFPCADDAITQLLRDGQSTSFPDSGPDKPFYHKETSDMDAYREYPPSDQTGRAHRYDADVYSKSLPPSLWQRILRHAPIGVPVLCLLAFAGYFFLEKAETREVGQLPRYRQQDQGFQPREYAGQRMQAYSAETVFARGGESGSASNAFPNFLAQAPGQKPEHTREQLPKPTFPQAKEELAQGSGSLVHEEESQPHRQELWEISRLLLELDFRLTNLENDLAKRASSEKAPEKKEPLAEDERKKDERKDKGPEQTRASESREQSGEGSRSRARMSQEKSGPCSDWEIVGFSGTRVAVRNKSGMHFLRVGQSLNGVSIKGIDVEHGRITTSEGVLRYR